MCAKALMKALNLAIQTPGIIADAGNHLEFNNPNELKNLLN